MMNSSKKVLVLLLITVMSLSMVYAPLAAAVPTAMNTVPAQPTASTPAPVDEIRNYVQDVIDDMPQEKMDPVLKSFMKSGYLPEDVVRTYDGDIKLVLYVSPGTDMRAVREAVDLNWRMDLKAFSVYSATLKTDDGLQKLESIDGVMYIQADTILDQATEAYDGNGDNIVGTDMIEINDVVGATDAWTAGYNGSGVIVGLDDTGTDFSQPDLKDAEYKNSTGFPMAFDPTGWGITVMTIANATPVENVTAWLEEGYLLTYESGGKYYLNVTGWDPLCHDRGYLDPLIGWYIDIYAGAWKVNNISDFAKDEMWKDWEIPAPTSANYTFGWAFQQRVDAYAKIFAPTMIYDDKLVVDWEGAMAWSTMWNLALRYKTLDLNKTSDQDYILNMMDWNFTDNYDDGEVYYPGGETILATDFDGDGFDDIGFGSLTWTIDSEGVTDSPNQFFCGISEDNLAWAAMFPSESSHGHWTAGAIASRGVMNHTIYDDKANYTLPGVAKGAKVIATKGVTSGSDLGAQFWAAGFHLAADGNFTYSAEGQQHKAHMISNSWGYINGYYLQLTYLALAWDIMSAPGVVDAAYPGTLFLVSAGNSGSDYMTDGAPDGAFSVVSVGGTIVNHYYENLYSPGQVTTNQDAWFASNGPGFVGHVKPDVVAPAFVGVNPAPSQNDWLGIGDTYFWWTGTSLACPIAAGVAAIITEALMTNVAGWTYDPQVIKDILLSTADDTGTDAFVQGHGIVNAKAAVDAIETGSGDSLIFRTDSFKNYASAVGDAWGYWMPESNPFGVWSNQSTPVGLESSSIYFGNVYPGNTYSANLTMMDYDMSTYVDTSAVTGVSSWHYAMKDIVTLDVTTYAYNDTNYWNATHQLYTTRPGVFNLTDLMDPADYANFLGANYVTVTAGFDVSYLGDIGMRIFDWNDTMANGELNYYFNATHPGDYVGHVARAFGDCNLMWARLASPLTVGSLFTYTPTIQLDGPVDVNVTLTFIIWESVADTDISFTPKGTYTLVNLTVPADAEPGIHEGFITVVNGSSVHNIPYSYMVAWTLGGTEGEVQTVVDGWGAEFTPYETGAIMTTFEAGSRRKMDGGGNHPILINIPDDYPTKNRTTLVMRVEWENEGTVVDMYLRRTTYHAITYSNDGYDENGFFAPTPTEPTKNTIIWDPGYLINGTYYLILSAHAFNGSAVPENITLTLQWYDGLPTPSYQPTWTSRTSTTPAVFGDGDTLVGDHVVIDSEWNITVPADLPEYNITKTRISLLSGLYAVRTGTIADPGGWDDWPIPLTETSHYVWETVDGIKAGDTVKVTLHIEAGNDPSFDVYPWTDDNEDGVVQTDELGASVLSVDDGGSGYDESGSFVASSDMSIAIRVFAWAWAYHPAEYTLEVDTRVSIDIDSTTNPYFATYDTYKTGKNGTFTVMVTAWTATDVVFTDTIGDVRFENFFSPRVTIDSVTSDTPSAGYVTISWSITDDNADDEFFSEVWVSSDGGTTFQVIQTNITGTSYVWDSRGWLIQDDYVIKVRVHDNDAVENPNALSTGNYWPDLTAEDIWTGVSAGTITPPTTTTTTTEPTTTTTPPGFAIDPLLIGLLGGIGVGVVVILILFLVKKK